MYCLEKKLKKYNYKDQIHAWVSNHYFRVSSLKEFAENSNFWFKDSNDFNKGLIHFNMYEAWYLMTDSKQGLDFLEFVKKYFRSPQKDHDFYFKRTETLINFLCTKSHDNVRFSAGLYLYTNAVIFNTICDLQNQMTKLYQYFINRAINSDLRWLTYALFLYETYFRLNKGEKKIYNEDPVSFYKYAEGKLSILQ